MRNIVYGGAVQKARGYMYIYKVKCTRHKSIAVGLEATVGDKIGAASVKKRERFKKSATKGSGLKDVLVMKE